MNKSFSNTGQRPSFAKQPVANAQVVHINGKDAKAMGRGLGEMCSNVMMANISPTDIGSMLEASSGVLGNVVGMVRQYHGNGIAIELLRLVTKIVSEQIAAEEAGKKGPMQ